MRHWLTCSSCLCPRWLPTFFRTNFIAGQWRTLASINADDDQQRRPFNAPRAFHLIQTVCRSAGRSRSYTIGAGLISQSIIIRQRTWRRAMHRLHVTSAYHADFTRVSGVHTTGYKFNPQNSQFPKFSVCPLGPYYVSGGWLHLHKIVIREYFRSLDIRNNQHLCPKTEILVTPLHAIATLSIGITGWRPMVSVVCLPAAPQVQLFGVGNWMELVSTALLIEELWVSQG